MKTLVTTFATMLILSALARAEGVVSAGTITAYNRETGMLTLQPSSRVNRPLVFQHMNKARIMLASGEDISASELEAGQRATVHYLWANKRWLISKVVVDGVQRYRPAMAQASLPRGERWGLSSKAARDRDITTQPGAKATIDRDITTNPGIKPAGDRDITKKAPDTANTDRDITTHKDRR